MALKKVLPATSTYLNHQTMMRKLSAAVLVLVICTFAAEAHAQSADRVPGSFDPAPSVVLRGHHPQWAIPANDAGALDPNKVIDSLTMVLQRSPDQQKAFEQFLEEQQNPGSPEYHHWLTPVEIGTRFGVSDHDIAQVNGWLESQGLHVNWVAPSKIFIAFGGTAASIGHAFGTPMHAYEVQGDDRISVMSDPMVPSALAPAILAVRGLYTVRERPQHSVRTEISNKPDIYLGSVGNNVIGPADFAKIYDLPTSLTGSGVNIGIVAEAHVDTADISEFQSFLGASFNTPTQVVPTAQGGVDPGAAYTTEPSCETNNTCSSSVSDYIDVQGEATLDVTRAGSVAPGANVVLVTAAVNDSGSDGIYTDAQYIIATTASPGPFQVMSISFGGCESGGGQSDVDAWDSVYQTAQGEGISVFVSSGDSGAAGCDAHGGAPPATAGVVSPNALCSSQYDTCVGGTEFNDASDYSAYWNESNGTGYESAKGYIPEGAWNEPGSSPNFQVASSGGGVSAYIATPTWQTGTGVPSARAGRYTPDVSFSASGHDGYFACLAVTGGTCISTEEGTPFVIFSGTSASAPDMAGIAALLDQKMGSGQGNINPKVYSLAASDPTAFHDVTVATSGVSSCSVSTPSMCNNSIPGQSTLTGGTQGYAVQTGYDEVTGLGSLDVANFIDDYAALSSAQAPKVTVVPTISPITYTEALTVTVTVSGSSGTPTGSVKLTSGSYTSSAATLSSGSASITVPGKSLAAGTDTLAVSYTPDSGSSSIYTTASGTAPETVNKATQTITFANPGTQKVGTPLALSATASSGLAVTFLSATTSVCTVTGTTAKFIAVGSCQINAHQAGNSDYAAATLVSQSFTVNIGTQTITFANPGTQTVGTPLALSATASSGLAVTFLSATTSVCTVTGTTAKFIAEGTCEIHAHQAGNSDYAAAPLVSQSFTVNPEAQTITFNNPGTQTVGKPLTLSAKASSGLAVAFTPTTTSVCMVSGTTATFIASGTCTIDANQAGNNDYAAAALVEQTFTVNGEAQTITFANPGTQTVGTPLTLSATASSGLAVTFLSATTSVCTVSGATAKFIAAGNCQINAHQVGNSTYAAATLVSQSFTVVAD